MSRDPLKWTQMAWMLLPSRRLLKSHASSNAHDPHQSSRSNHAQARAQHQRNLSTLDQAHDQFPHSLAILHPANAAAVLGTPRANDEATIPSYEGN